MKVRKLAVALALAGALGAEMAHAVGLGQIKLESYLNQPLKAQINLLDVGDLSPDQIIVGLASSQDFSQAGIKRTYNLSNLKFKVVRRSNGNMVVNITTDQPVHEPYMDFLVDLNWPNGRVMREYTLLVDPPTYEKGERAAPVHAAPSVSESPAPQSQPSGSASPAATPSAPAGGNAAPQGGGTYGPVKSSDTLWGIAQKYKPSARITTQQEMLAIQDQNPDAFVDGNINRLKRGHVLRLPSRQQAESRTRHQAVREVIAQNHAFKSKQQASRHPAVNATGANETAQGGSSKAAAGQDQLKLVVANKGKESTKGSHGGGNGGTSQSSLRNKLSVTQEEVDKLQRDNSDLNTRLQDLQDQVKTLKRLIELKNDQLTALQTEAGQQGAKPASGMVAGTSAPAATAATSQGSSSAAAPGGSATTSSPATAPITSRPEATAKAPAMTGSTSKPEVSPGTASKPAATEAKPAQPAAHAKPEVMTGQGAAQHPRNFWGNLTHQLITNPLYQLGAGVIGILVLIVLWLLARRNAHHEKQFYENLKDAEEGDSLDLGMDEEASASKDAESEAEAGHDHGEDDAISEADVYIAYGRFDQAAHLLEEAISAEPSRTDLRLKLLETYGESGNQDAFDKQFRELEAIADEESMASAQALRSRLQETEQGPSISDLESELKAGVASSLDESATESEKPDTTGSDEEFETLGIDWDLDSSSEEDQTSGDTSVESGAEEAESDDHGGIDFDLGELDLDEETGETKAEEETSEAGDLDLSSLSDELEGALGEDTETDKDDDQGIEYTLEETDESERAEELDLSDLDELTLDSETHSLEETTEADTDETETPEESDAAERDSSAEMEESLAGSQEEPDLDALTGEPDDGPIDESFLDELDAELDKVTGADEGDSAESGTAPEEETASEPESGEDEAEEIAGEDVLGDLELDVSDEDLALLEEASRAGEDEEDAAIPELGEEDQAETASGEKPETQDEADHPAGQSEDQSDDLEEPLLDVGLDETSDALMEEGDALPESEWDDLELSDADLDLGEDDLEGLEEETGSDEEETTAEDLDLGDTDLGELEEPTEADEAAQAESQTPSAEGLDMEPEDDDFDFLAGTDEAATKLDLARAYIEMGDADGARDILEEVSLEGNEEQKKEAQDMLKSIT